MKATDYINAVKKINGHGQEIIQIFSNATGRRLFTTLTSTNDEEIIENAMFELDYDNAELRRVIAEYVISLK